MEYDKELTAATVPEEIAALGVRGVGIEADVTQKDSVEELFNALDQEFGRLDGYTGQQRGWRALWQ